MTDTRDPGIATIADAIEDIAAGRMVILVDDEDRENEGDLVVAAQYATPEALRFMMEEGRGLICLALDPSIIERLDLAPMAQNNESPLGTAFTVSIDAARGIGHGASAIDRAETVRVAIQPSAAPDDLVSPGHMFPLRARPGGVLVRSGQTEGSVDLARLAGLVPAGVICEIMAQDGTMARLPTLLEFGRRNGIRVVTVADLIAYRMRTERLVTCEAESDLPTRFGNFRMRVYTSHVDGSTHVALQLGSVDTAGETLVRVHRANMLADVFDFTLSVSRSHLERAMQAVAHAGGGVILYLATDRGADDIVSLLDVYAARSKGEAEPEVARRKASALDFRDFGTGAQILVDMGVKRLRVLTDRPRRMRGIGGFGLEIAECVPFSAVADADP